MNMSSISAFIAQPNRWTYNAAKGAVHTLTKCMALDLAPYNIRVNSVSPGWIWTREVDKAAGMTWPRMLEEGVSDRVCIIGNIDARHTLCHGTPSEVRAEVRECLDYGRRAKGGHILHASHSVHEDVKTDNYFAVVNAYREYFEMEPLPN